MTKDTRMSDVLHVLLHLSQAEEPLTSEKLAQSLGTNPAVFRRTMAGLRNTGYVETGRGHGGGWKLARPLKEITLQDVYQALGRPNLFAIGSRSERPACKIEKNVNDALEETMSQADELFARRFDSITLDTLMPVRSTPLRKGCV